MSTTQAEFNKNIASNTTGQKAADNAREAEKKRKADVQKVQTLHDSITAIERYQIAPAKAAISAAEKARTPLQEAYNAYTRAHVNDPGYPTPGDTLTLNAILGQIAPYNKTISDNKKLIADYQASIDKIKTEIKKLSPSLQFGRNIQPKGTTKPPGSTNPPKVEKLEFSKDYKYNAPMVSTAYFQNSSIENTVLDGKLVDQGKYSDAKNAWKGTTGGRGTIQMDRKFLSSFTSSVLKDKKDKGKIDTQKYGFKFLYNPQTVSMSWGLMSQMDPVYEATQYDPFQVVSPGLMSATVEFEILLNRIKDFDYLDSNGLTSAQATKTNSANIPADADPAQRMNIYNANFAKNFPYPETISIEDMQEIYNKGTMYDLEYFFKTINGPDGTFVSQLNGTTADKAFLRPTIVELHLGNKMRYRVRISSFSVNHVIFNNRMVPMLSTVRLVCNRFVDGPQSNVNSGGGVKTPPSGLKNLQNQVPGYGR